MSAPKSGANILRPTEVRRISQPIILDPTSGSEGNDNCMSIIPVMDGEEIAGMDIRCNCGSRMLIECVYDEVGE